MTLILLKEWSFESDEIGMKVAFQSTELGGIDHRGDFNLGADVGALWAIKIWGASFSDEVRWE